MTSKLYIMPQTGFMRLSDVLKVIPIGKTTWWDGIKTGRFPKPIKLGKRTTAWKAEDIRSLIDALANQSHDQSVTYN